jgi:hypothetical protein
VTLFLKEVEVVMGAREEISEEGEDVELVNLSLLLSMK